MEVNANKVIEIITEQLRQANLNLAIATVQIQELQLQIKEEADKK